jgi:hypothetical protein
MTLVKRSKKNVLLVLLLTCMLSATLVILRLHITSATEEWHNISVERIFDVTYPTWDSSYNRTYGVHVKNNGTTSENFTLTIYDTTDSQLIPVGEKNVSLSSGTEEIIKFTLNYSSVSDYPDDPSKAWNVTGYFIHEINATASTVEDEAITEDNSKIANVTVKWPGDANGDGYVNEDDLDIILPAWGEEFPDTNYIKNVTADFDGNGEIDIVDTTTWSINQGKGPLDYADINVTRIFPVTYPTWDSSHNLTFAVTVKNKGWGNTTHFNLTIYNGATPLATKTNLTLGPKANEIIKFTLNCTALNQYPDNPENLTMPYPTHTISASATELPNEWNTEDNSCDNTTVTVRWPGDANGDGQVNATDRDIVVPLFGKKFPHPEYDPQADFDCNGLIDIGDSNIISSPHWHNGPLDYVDVDITDVVLRLPNRPESLSMAYPDWTVNVKITVKNNGNTTENCTVRAYYQINNTAWILIGNTTFINLAPEEESTQIIQWEVPAIEKKFPYDNYTVKAKRTTFPYEDTADNNTKLADTVKVRWRGDANGDGHINATDLTEEFRKDIPGIIDYDPRSDFDGNGVIDIDDVVILIDNWEQEPED